MENTLYSASNGTIGKEFPGPGFLAVAAGGSGKDSVLALKKHHEAAYAPFALQTIAIDTDPTKFDSFDGVVNIAPTREAVSAMASNPKRSGPACRTIVEHHPHLLEANALGMGARTHRIFTQAAFELFELQITEGLRSAIHALLRKGHFDQIQPVFIASLGGGTGSAAIILLLDIFMDPNKKSRMMMGLPPDLVARPVAFVINPYAHALQQHNEVSPDWILGNIYATRVELAEYERQGKVYQYVFHLGLGNNAGAVFSTIDQVCQANGLLAYEWMANYPQFKGQAVNGFDFHKDACRYQGDDVPELFFADEEMPPYADIA